MKDWFANLEQREQWMVGGGGAIALVIILWAFVWLPLDRGQERLDADVATWQRALSDLRGIAAQSGQPGGVQPIRGDTGSESPVVIVDRTLRERSLNNSVQRRQPVPNGIRVEFEDVPFDQLVVWLGDVYSGYGLAVQNGSMSLSSRNEPGRINATLTLERAP
ncbi:MAG: type II secretion system protein M [Woeseiaceae bacterium]|nr:type II secretion system protein M [Woeseiaceae bacterium]